MDNTQDKFTVGVDIGTHKIAIAVGQTREGLINIIGLATVPSTGLRKGTVIDPEEVVSSLSLALEEAQRISGTQITHALIGYGGTGVTTSISKGVVAISQPNGEIVEDDMARVVDSARSVALPPNQEIIHMFPTKFIIDSQEHTKNPCGMKGIRLETEAMVIGVPTANIKNLTKAVHQAGIDISAIVFNPIASSRTLLNKKQKELGVALIDIGAATTTMVVYEEGELIDAFVIPVGSSHITNDIAIGIKTTLEVAEKIKCQHLNAGLDKVKDSEKVDLSKISDQEEEKVSKKFLTEIVDSRLKELFGMLRKELKRVKRDNLLPAGVVLTGGGAKMPGIVAQAKENLHLPAQLGVPSMEIGGTIDKLDDPSYSTSIGLALLGFEIGTPERSSRKIVFNIKNINLGGVVGKAKQLFKQLMP
jgi:cell division protein FtsA